MSHSIYGNTKGLSPSQLRRIEKLSDRRVAPDDMIGGRLARELFRTANEVGRRLGLLITREGDIEQVVIGTREILYLPDLGRYRYGRGRLRRLRLVFSDLTKSDTAKLPQDILTDLEKLRLDMVVAVKEIGERITAKMAHLVPLTDPSNPPVETEDIHDLFRHEDSFQSIIESLENELQLARTSTPPRNSALLVGVYDSPQREAEESMSELKELARTAGVQVLDVVVQRRKPDPRTLIGKGKLEQIVLMCLRLEADMIIFDTELKPSQWRVITNAVELKVLDRSMLILDIFAQRASSSVGRLQVELAQLRYNLPRLVEKDAGLSRLTGGIGGRGPGETKLEIGRRRIRDRIADLEKRIDKLSRQREEQRKKRKSIPVPLLAILGYTNAGKSTLFNALTSSEVLAEDKLFATLDPAQRRMVIPPRAPEDGYGIPVVLTDTVGFIRELPEELKNAFRATLEELYQAHVLIQVIDAAASTREEMKASVDAVLSEMDLLQAPRIVVWNKIDCVDKDEVERLVTEYGGIPVSAEQKIGFDKLREAIVCSLESQHLIEPVEETYESGIV